MTQGIKYKKIYQALNFFAIQEGGKINRMKTLKLIWLSDRLHVRKYGRTITGDVYYAMKNGAVPSNAKSFAESNKDYIEPLEHKYGSQYIKPIGDYDYKSIKELDTRVFSKSDINIMTEVYGEFGTKNEFDLAEFSHIYPEWNKFESRINQGFTAREVMEITDFFRNPNTPDIPMFNQSKKLLKISKEDFLLKKTTDEKGQWIKTDMYLHGEITNVGGKTIANIYIDTDECGTVIAEVDKDKLTDKNLLYSSYRVLIECEQDYKTRTIRKAKVLMLEPLKQVKDFDTYMKEKIDIASPNWEGVDLDKWLKSIR